MLDFFALLHLPRQPWIDPEFLKERFNALSTELHPDKAAPLNNEEARAQATAAFADLNGAYQTLRDIRTRLAHLILLERGAAPANLEQVSNEAANVFFEVSQVCRQVDAFLAAKIKLTSPLAKAAHFSQSLDLTDRVQNLLQSIADKKKGAEEEVRAISDAWSRDTTPGSRANEHGIERLKEIYRQLGYLTRWTDQLQERLVHLAV